METRESAARGGTGNQVGRLGKKGDKWGDLTVLGVLYAAPILSELETDKGYSSPPFKRHVGKEHQKQT